MMREASDIAADSTIVRNYGWDDLDRDAVARYRRRYQTQNPGSPWNLYEDERFLQAIGGFSRDRDTGVEGLTVAGLLLLGTPEAIREWRTRHLIDFRLVSGQDPDARWDDRITWEGNLLGAFETIYPRLTEELPTPFRLRNGVRIDQGPVHVALREALVNLLTHADYAETHASLIVRSPTGFRFRNPGSSRIPDVDLLIGDQSDPRNPQLVRMFRLVGLAEEAGTGMPRIVRAWRDLGYHLPTIHTGTERYEFTLELRYAHLLSDADRTWLESIGGGWTEAEQLALVLAKHEGGVDNLRLRGLTDQHPADVTKVLGGLRDRKYLQMIGWGRGARYELGPAVTLGPLFAKSVSSDLGVVNSDTTTPNSDTERSDSDTTAPSSDTKASDSDTTAPSSDTKASGSARTEDLREELHAIAQTIRAHRRLDLDVRNAVLVQLCARVPLSLRDIADLTGRSDISLRKALRELVARGRLIYEYPDQPNHPRQRYMAADARSAQG